MPSNGKLLKPGKVVSVQGPVVDVQFENEIEVPDIHQVIWVKSTDNREITLEVAEHLPGNTARCIAIQSTLNVQRHAEGRPAGRQIEIPVGDCLYERVINCIGGPLDKDGPIISKQFAPIRRAESGTKVPDFRKWIRSCNGARPATPLRLS